MQVKQQIQAHFGNNKKGSIRCIALILKNTVFKGDLNLCMLIISTII